MKWPLDLMPTPSRISLFLSDFAWRKAEAWYRCKPSRTMSRYYVEDLGHARQDCWGWKKFCLALATRTGDDEEPLGMPDRRTSCAAKRSAYPLPTKREPHRMDRETGTG